MYESHGHPTLEQVEAAIAAAVAENPERQAVLDAGSDEEEQLLPHPFEVPDDEPGRLQVSSLQRVINFFSSESSSTCFQAAHVQEEERAAEPEVRLRHICASSQQDPKEALLTAVSTTADGPSDAAARYERAPAAGSRRGGGLLARAG